MQGVVDKKIGCEPSLNGVETKKVGDKEKDPSPLGQHTIETEEALSPRHKAAFDVMAYWDGLNDPDSGPFLDFWNNEDTRTAFKHFRETKEIELGSFGLRDNCASHIYGKRVQYEQALLRQKRATLWDNYGESKESCEKNKSLPKELSRFNKEEIHAFAKDAILEYYPPSLN